MFKYENDEAEYTKKDHGLSQARYEINAHEKFLDSGVCTADSFSTPVAILI